MTRPNQRRNLALEDLREIARPERVLLDTGRKYMQRYLTLYALLSCLFLAGCENFKPYGEYRGNGPVKFSETRVR